MSGESPQDKASTALYEKIAELAAGCENGTELTGVADAYAKVAFGPQGGDSVEWKHAQSESKSTSTSESKASSTSRNTTDYHETIHPNGAPKNAPGFTEREA